MNFKLDQTKDKSVVAEYRSEEITTAIAIEALNKYIAKLANN